MQTALLQRVLGQRCRDLHARVRRIVLGVTALVILLTSQSAFAWPRSHRQPIDLRNIDTRHWEPGSIDLTNEIGPLLLSDATFNASGTDTGGVHRDQSLSGSALGVGSLVFDQVALSFRFGVTDHFSIGVPFSFGAAPVSEALYSANSSTANDIRANGEAAGLLGIGFSPGYEINFGDSAIRIDTALLARAIFVPTNLGTVDKHGRPVAADAVAGQLAFEPRITILPYAHGALGAGFYAEVDAIHPENWSCGGVLQLRFGRGS